MVSFKTKETRKKRTGPKVYLIQKKRARRQHANAFHCNVEMFQSAMGSLLKRWAGLKPIGGVARGRVGENK